MKTIREYIDLIESAQTPVAEGKNNIDDKIIHLMTNGIPADEIARKLDIPVEWVHEVAKYNMPDSAIDYNDPRNSTQGRERFGEQGVAESTDQDVEHLANAFADIYYGGAGMGMISATEKVKLARNIVQAVDDGRLSVEQLKQDLKDVGELQQKLGRDGRVDKPGVAEAISKTDLLKQVSAKLNDPKFRKQPADPTKSFTKGDHWQGAKPGDYGYTGYQGHGMPTDRAEQARIRADKKKGLPEDEATAKMGLMSAMGSNDNNPADQRRAMAQQAVERLATKR